MLGGTEMSKKSYFELKFADKRGILEQNYNLPLC